METYGGGEKLVTYAAKALEDNNNIDIIMRMPNTVTIKSIRDRLGVGLTSTELVTLLSAESMELYRDYDIFINNEWKSTSRGIGKYNIYYTMFPGKDANLSFLDSYDLILSISEYTSKYIKEYWGKDSKILHPPVTMMATAQDIMSMMKSDIILTVGRFFEGEHCKKHMVMIEAFRMLEDEYHTGWKLSMVGALRNNPLDMEYYNRCVDAAKGYNIEFLPNIPYNDLVNMYRMSKIYWHAAGCGETDPMCFEHFGISPVEAMSAGCIPVLFNGGGLLETASVVDHWSDVGDLLDITTRYMGSDYTIHKQLITKIFEESQRYNSNSYMDGVRKYVNY